MKTPRSHGAWFAAALVLVAALLVADVLVLGAGEARRTRSSFEVQDDRVVLATTVGAAPGDVVAVQVERMPGAPFASYDFLVVEEGEWRDVAAGRVPAHVHHERRAIPADACCGEDLLHVERPARPPGSAGGLDLVWVLRYEAGTQRPPPGDARTYFDSWVRLAAQGESRSPVVVSASAARAHGALLAAEAATLLGALALGVSWARGALARREAALGPREGLVGLVEEGGAYLRRLRALWLGLLPALVFGAAFGAGAIAGRLEELAGPSDAWSAPVTAVLVVLVAALAAAWALSAFTVHRALARWREGMAQRPLGL